MGGEDANPLIADHFIRHYQDVVGVTDFHIYVHKNMRFAERLHTLGIPFTLLFEFNEATKKNLFNRVIDESAPDWCLTCDMDEFHQYGGDGSFFGYLPDDPDLHGLHPEGRD